jgi:hypothetical protein
MCSSFLAFVAFSTRCAARVAAQRGETENRIPLFLKML